MLVQSREGLPKRHMVRHPIKHKKQKFLKSFGSIQFNEAMIASKAHQGTSRCNQSFDLPSHNLKDITKVSAQESMGPHQSPLGLAATIGSPLQSTVIKVLFRIQSAYAHRLERERNCSNLLQMLGCQALEGHLELQTHNRAASSRREDEQEMNSARVLLLLKRKVIIDFLQGRKILREEVTLFGICLANLDSNEV